MSEADDLKQLLFDLANGTATVEEALKTIQCQTEDDLGFARIDCSRETRCGFPEVIYGAGKTPEQLVSIAQSFQARQKSLFVTRISAEGAAALLGECPDAVHDDLARTVTLMAAGAAERDGNVAVVCAGTSDLPVSGECVNTLRFLGYSPHLVTDVGVAGLHRLLSRKHELTEADVVIVIAGMEGALPSVVGGMVKVPVVAVPTSVGYGAGFNGIAPLLGMLNSCASGITVVNIDNGFGAACAAHRILG